MLADFSEGSGRVFEGNDALTLRFQRVPLKYFVSAVDLRVKGLSNIQKVLGLVFIL